MYDINKASQALEDLELKFKLGNADIDVQWFRVMQTGKGWHIERHAHSFFEFHFIRSGSCTVHIDTEVLTIRPGEFYVNAPGVYHEQSGTCNEGVVEYCLSCCISPEKGEDETGRILEILTDTPCMVHRDSETVFDLFEKALEEAYYKRVGYYNQIVGMTTLIILSAARVMAERKAAGYKVPLKSSNGDRRFYQISKFLDDNITEPVSVGQLSDFMHLSGRQISRITTKNTGLPAKEFIIGKKLEKATEMLKGTDLSIREISERLGFSSEYYFSQFYKRLSGRTPSAVRKH